MSEVQIPVGEGKDFLQAMSAFSEV